MTSFCDSDGEATPFQGREMKWTRSKFTERFQRPPAGQVAPLQGGSRGSPGADALAAALGWWSLHPPVPSRVKGGLPVRLGHFGAETDTAHGPLGPSLEAAEREFTLGPFRQESRFAGASSTRQILQ